MDNIVFGIRPVIEAIESGRQIEKVYVRKGAEGQLLSELKSVCKAQKVHMQEVPVEKLNRMTKLNHQGVVATVSPIVYADVEEILSSVPEGEAGLIVLLDSITDVRNFGAIARSAECVGAHGLITSLKSSAPVNAEAIKSSAGALNIIPVARVGSIRNTLKALQAEGYQIAAATEKAEQTVYEADLTRPTVLVMGSEDTGISKEVLKMCDCQMAIPMKGRIESLNVSAAAAVILFEIQRQRISK
jgi:23S rRNA (guanosine2251-2'-O)-methyltransferase